MDRIAALDKNFLHSNPIREAYIVGQILGFEDCSAADLREIRRAVSEFYRTDGNGRSKYTDEYFSLMDKRNRILHIIEDEICRKCS